MSSRLIAIHVGNREPRTELRQFPRKQELALVVVKRRFVVFEFESELFCNLGKYPWRRRLDRNGLRPCDRGETGREAPGDAATAGRLSASLMTTS